MESPNVTYRLLRADYDVKNIPYTIKDDIGSSVEFLLLELATVV